MTRARRVRAAALTAAALCCALGAQQYAQALSDPVRQEATARDQALADGSRAVARLGSLDPGTGSAVPAAWLDATTGELHTRLTRLPPLQGQPAAAATVTAAAVTDLDAHAGTARLIAVLSVDPTRPEQNPGGTERRRVEATMLRTGAGWKVTGLTAVPVGEGGR
ncbi:hypothetical protein KNE206_67080 [Kitasatospora sp. NE20-6]|uniref:hypothetical protein n=1 Tax=Kitasatospora sp. NE20-6 TaxID=2859066 RepID=UPI0034DBE0CA